MNPNSVKFTQTAQLSGKDLANFKSKLSRLKSIAPGAALAPLQSETIIDEPEREIEKLSKAAKTKIRTSAVFPMKSKKPNVPIKDVHYRPYSIIEFAILSYAHLSAIDRL